MQPLNWYVIEWGAQNGYSRFDFGGAGRPDQAYGPRDFKAKFGGELVLWAQYLRQLTEPASPQSVGIQVISLSAVTNSAIITMPVFDQYHPLRICMVVHNSYPFAETRVQREAGALVRHGIEVDVICLQYSSEPRQEVVSGVNVHRLPIKRRKGRGLIAQFIEYLLFFVLASMRTTFMHMRRRYKSSSFSIDMQGEDVCEHGSS